MSQRLLSLALLLVAASAGCSDRKPIAGAGPGLRTAGAVELGPVSSDAEFDLVIGVRLRDPIKLGKFLDAQPFTGDAMSASDFADGFAISAGGYARLVASLRAAGFTIVRVADGRTSVTVRATADVIERALGAELRQFEDGDGRFVASVTALTLPPDVEPSVSGVVGVEGGLAWRPHMIPPSAVPQASGQSFGASDLESQYNTSAITKPGDGETIAILGAGNGPVAADIAGYYTTYKPYGLTAAPATYHVDLVGGANRDGNDIAELERQENTLDIDMVSAIAPYANVEHVLTATNTPGLFADGISYIVNQLKNVHAVSVSYGTCERGAAGYMPVVHAMLAQAKAQGQTWFFASGDTGSDGCRNGTSNKVFSAGWPASAPFAIGVGGTQIDTTNNSEVVWNTNPGSASFPAGGSGGGASETLPKPDYQLGVTPNDSARDEPDVSALAGPPEVAIYISGFNLTDNTAPVGGTSASAPMWAGIWALLSQAHPTLTINNAHERIYALGKAGGVFHDIVSGNNGGPGATATGGHPATPGYDLATGWGTPDVAALVANW